MMARIILGLGRFLFAWLVCWLAIPSHAAAPAEAPIRIGATVSLSGKYEEPGTAELEGLQIWVDDVNARGALLGRKVELIFHDDQSDAEMSAKLYERLIVQDKVDLLVGPYSSELTLIASGIAERHNFPMVAAGAASSVIWEQGFNNIFQIDAGAATYMHLPLRFAKQQGLSRIALLHAESEFPQEVVAGARKEAATLGLSIVFDESYPLGTANFSRLVEQVQAAGPEVVLGGTYLDDSIALMRQAKLSGLSPKLIAFTVGPALPEFGEALGEDAEGVMGAVAWMRGASLPMSQDFSYRYKEKFGRNAGVHAVYGYAAGQVLEAAVRLAGSLDKNRIREELYALKFRSLLGRYQVDEQGMQQGKSIYIMQWQDGHRRLVLPERYARLPVRYPFKPWSERLK